MRPRSEDALRAGRSGPHCAHRRYSLGCCFGREGLLAPLSTVAGLAEPLVLHRDVQVLKNASLFSTPSTNGFLNTVKTNNPQKDCAAHSRIHPQVGSPTLTRPTAEEECTQEFPVPLPIGAATTAEEDCAAVFPIHLVMAECRRTAFGQNRI